MYCRLVAVSDIPAPPVAQPPPTKEQLEIAKLQLEVRYIKREYRLKLINTLLLISAAILGFYFFQLPQIDHLLATRMAAEKQHTDNAIAAYLNMKDANDKKIYMSHLRIQYPQYAFLATVDQSAATVQAEPDSNVSPQARCDELFRLIRALTESERALRRDMEEEERGLRGSPDKRQFGRGPVYSLLFQQQVDVRTRRENLLAQRSRLNCT
jgi:hypothetical protein